MSKTERNLEWLVSAPDVQNLATKLTQEELGKLGPLVVRMYELDRENRREWDDLSASALKLAKQIKEEKNTPWPKAANVKHPLITSATIQFAARAYPEICKGNRVVKCQITGNDPKPVVPVVPPGQVGPPVQPGQLPGQQMQVRPGGVNPQLPQQPGQQMMPGQLPAGPNLTGQTQSIPKSPKQARAERIENHMNWMLTQQIEEWESDMDSLLHVIPVVGQAYKKTYFDKEVNHNVSELVLPDDCVVSKGKSRSIYKARRITHRLWYYENDVQERVGNGLWTDIGYLGRPAGDALDEDAPHEFLEQHCYYDLDGDGYKEPYIITVHKETQKVVWVHARWQMEGITPPKNRKHKLNVSKIEPDHYFTHFGFIPNPDGSMNALGFGQLLEGINSSVNTAINQLIDSGTLSNMGGGFIGRGIRMRGGTMDFTVPGEWKLVDVTGGTLKENIVPLPVREPSVVLFQLLGFLVQAGKEISSVQDILTGDAKLAASMPVGTAMALVEQGLKVFTAIYKRIYRSLGEEFKKLYKLNSLYLDPEFTYYLSGSTENTVFQRDYILGDTLVMPVADPDLSSDMQRLLKGQALKELSGRPGVNEVELTRRLVRSIRPDSVDELLLTDNQMNGSEPTPWKPPPPPQMVVAQAKAVRLQSQAQEDMIRLQMDMQKFSVEMESLLTDIENKKADTILKLASAGSKVQTGVMEKYKMEMNQLSEQVKFQVEMIKERMKANVAGQGNPNRPSGMVPVERKPGNPGVLPGPAEGAGGMGGQVS